MMIRAELWRWTRVRKGGQRRTSHNTRPAHATYKKHMCSITTTRPVQPKSYVVQSMIQGRVCCGAPSRANKGDTLLPQWPRRSGGCVGCVEILLPTKPSLNPSPSSRQYCYNFLFLFVVILCFGRWIFKAECKGGTRTTPATLTKPSS